MNTDMNTVGIWVFGYGSLVNPATHSYVQTRPAILNGWRREWRHFIDTPDHKTVSLTVKRDPNYRIAGLIAFVPAADCAALDQREKGYDRITLTHAELSHNDAKIVLYQSQAPRDGASSHPILQSYLDAVLQGFFAQHGRAGIIDFLQTTSGWKTPIKRDRHAPIYPRSVNLSVREAMEFDTILADHGAIWQP